MKDFWNSRYNTTDYIYGTKPNEFFAKSIATLNRGKLLLVGEGEGRNAVFAAKLGWVVTCIDFSDVAHNKAMQLARKNKDIDFSYHVMDVLKYETNERYDAIASIFLHLKPEHRSLFHKNMIELLTENGVFIAEYFSKDQLAFSSGGPRNVDMLYSIDDLSIDFKELSLTKLEKTSKSLYEGEYHRGKASVIDILAKKINN